MPKQTQNKAKQTQILSAISVADQSQNERNIYYNKGL
jgi:hypothetical protein